MGHWQNSYVVWSTPIFLFFCRKNRKNRKIRYFSLHWQYEWSGLQTAGVGMRVRADEIVLVCFNMCLLRHVSTKSFHMHIFLIYCRYNTYSYCRHTHHFTLRHFHKHLAPLNNRAHQMHPYSTV